MSDERLHRHPNRPAELGNPIVKTFFKDNLPHIAITLVGMIFSAGIGIGTYAASSAGRFERVETRVADIEKSAPAETRWLSQQNSAAIKAMQDDNRSMQQNISTINTNVGVLNSKMDTVIDQLKRRGE